MFCNREILRTRYEYIVIWNRNVIYIWLLPWSSGLRPSFDSIAIPKVLVFIPGQVIYKLTFLVSECLWYSRCFQFP